MNHKLVTIGIVIILSSMFQSGSTQCSFTDTSTGCVYDLSSMAIPSGQTDYSLNTTSTIAYWVNICAPVSALYGCASDAGVCQTTTGSSSANCGLTTQTTFGPYAGAAVSETCQGVQLVYDGGTFCPGAGRARESILNIGCNPNLPKDTQLSATVIETVVEAPGCVYTMQMYSAYACGSQGASTPSASSSPGGAPATPSASASASKAVAASSSASASASKSQAVAASPSQTGSSAATPSATTSTSVILSPTGTSTVTPTATTTPSETATSSVSRSSTKSQSETPSITPTISDSSSATPSISHTPSISSSPPPDIVEWYWWTLTVVAFLCLGLVLGVSISVIALRTYWKHKTRFDALGYE